MKDPGGQTEKSSSHPVTMSSGHPVTPTRGRRILETALLLFLVLLILRAFCVEPYGVPTGSMAPALAGNHKAADCPQCGWRVVVGHRDDLSGARAAEHWAVCCPNCGCDDIDLEHQSVCRGDQLLVNKTVFDWRRPRRWEMAVFHCPLGRGKICVKRVVGLPGETVQVKDGDIWIDHALARKPLAEVKALRIPVFDGNHSRGERWQTQPPSGPAVLEGTVLRLDARDDPDHDRWLIYRHWRLDQPKARALGGEYSYNGGSPGQAVEPVYDFMVECDLEVLAGDGWVKLGLCDGAEDLTAELPVGSVKQGARIADGADRVYRCAPAFALAAGRTYRVELALVDRRLTLAIDGRQPLEPVDRPPAEQRAPVEKPVRLGARGVDVRIGNVRLFRDVHYTEVGSHGIRTPVRLGAGEYWVLGDNSPNSDDNRFWSEADGRPAPVPEAHFVGKPFLVHLPSRVVRWQGSGGEWEAMTLDWGRVRWLR